MSPETISLKLFYCYAQEDKALRDELEIHLSGLTKQYNLIHWSDRNITPGTEWEHTISQQIEHANIILLLISPHFLASYYCYEKEMQQALDHHTSGECCVIPILLRPTLWEDMPFSRIQLLPTNTQPVTRWNDRDEAFFDIAQGISTAIKTRLDTLLQKYEHFLHRHPHNVRAWYKKGFILYTLKRYEEALSAFQRAIQGNPLTSDLHLWKGRVLMALGRYDEALDANDRARQLKGKLPHSTSNATKELKDWLRTNNKNWEDVEVIGPEDE